jgi:PHD/YefM family antitoxin component YafN of YafNO toxin-antitoxin module
MNTKWLDSREFSASPSRALATLGREGRVLVTANGKPRAIMIPTSEATYAQDLEMLDRVTLAQSVATIRADSVLQGADGISLGVINREIDAARSSRKRSRAV